MAVQVINKTNSDLMAQDENERNNKSYYSAETCDFNPMTTKTFRATARQQYDNEKSQKRINIGLNQVAK